MGPSGSRVLRFDGACGAEGGGIALRAIIYNAAFGSSEGSPSRLPIEKGLCRKVLFLGNPISKTGNHSLERCSKSYMLSSMGL